MVCTLCKRNGDALPGSSMMKSPWRVNVRPGCRHSLPCACVGKPNLSLAQSIGGPVDSEGISGSSNQRSPCRSLLSGNPADQRAAFALRPLSYHKCLTSKKYKPPLQPGRPSVVLTVGKIPSACLNFFPACSLTRVCTILTPCSSPCQRRCTPSPVDPYRQRACAPFSCHASPPLGVAQTVQTHTLTLGTYPEDGITPKRNTG